MYVKRTRHLFTWR